MYSVRGLELYSAFASFIMFTPVYVFHGLLSHEMIGANRCGQGSEVG